MAAYDARFGYLIANSEQLEITLIDGEVVYGLTKLKEPERELRKLTAQLTVAMRHFVVSRLNERDKDMLIRKMGYPLGWRMAMTMMPSWLRSLNRLRNVESPT